MFTLHEPLDDASRDALNAYDDLTAALLARRGVTTAAAADAFLNPSYDLHVHDPLRMTDMPKAADRFARAILQKEKIAVWSDYDCDGIPGATLLHDFLTKAGANFVTYIPHRHLEGYGMNMHGVESLAKDGASLLVTVDSGITDLAPVAHANALGIEVIVTDHHLPGEQLPDAYAVVNPNARNNEPYPFHGLCGSGVAWKLVCAALAVSPELRARIPVGWEKWLLDMVALATVADMVPLCDENRVLVWYGLVVMRKSPRIGLQKLCRTARCEQRTLTEDDIGFMLAPRVNAASRMGDARGAFELFTTNDEARADELAKHLEKLNRTRKSEAGAITHAVHARLKERIEMPSVIALGDPEWRPALLGLVANSIAEEFSRPVFLWGREGDATIKGSVRSGTVNALELMRGARDAFVEFGGHAASGGFTAHEDAIFTLEEKLVSALARLMVSTDEDSSLARADIDIAPAEVTHALLKKLQRLAPFGIGNEKPCVRMRAVVVRTVSQFGKGGEHRKICFASGETDTLDGIVFFARGALVQTIDSITEGDAVHILAHLERDMFSRGRPVRLRLLAIAKADRT